MTYIIPATIVTTSDKCQCKDKSIIYSMEVNVFLVDEKGLPIDILDNNIRMKGKCIKCNKEFDVDKNGIYLNKINKYIPNNPFIE